DLAQRSRQRRYLQLSLQPQPHRHVVDRITWLHLVQKPEPLLRKRQRQWLLSRRPLDRRQRAPFTFLLGSQPFVSEPLSQLPGPLPQPVLVQPLSPALRYLG